IGPPSVIRIENDDVSRDGIRAGVGQPVHQHAVAGQKSLFHGTRWHVVRLRDEGQHCSDDDERGDQMEPRAAGDATPERARCGGVIGAHASIFAHCHECTVQQIVWKRCREVVGCMSQNALSVMLTAQSVNGWGRTLTGDLGRSVLGNVIDVVAVMRLQGHGGEHPTAARRHRSTMATEHVFHKGARWTWENQPRSHDAVAGLLFADVPMLVRGEGDDEITAAGQAAFLHPHRRSSLEAMTAGASVCVWVPWDSLHEVEDGVQAPGQVMPSTPLTAGLRAFVTSLLNQQTEPTLYTDYLVERVIVEMAFGVLLESVPKNVIGARDG